MCRTTFLVQGSKYEERAEKCEAMGGEVQGFGEFMSCPDIDEEGYRFYWRIDSNGEWYKQR